MAAKFSRIAGYYQKLTKRERLFVSITMLSLFSWLLFQFPYSMMERSMRSLQNSISALENDVLEESVRTAELQRRASIDVSASAGWDLADQKNVVLFFEDVSGTARRIGVSLVGVHPAQELDKERYKEVSMNLDLKGRYRELGEYFERLESLQKVVNVRKIRIESCPDSSSVCAAQIEAVTFMPK